MKAGLRDLRGSSARRVNGLVWFGVLGGPAAWALQFLFAMQFGLARCESPNARFQFPVHTISAVLGGAAVFIGVVAELAAIVVYRAADHDRLPAGVSEITTGRLRFLAAVGMTVNPLALTISAMVAIGAPLLGICHQS
jgi:hypothetical protein